jgi:hypothetical protein
MLPFLIVLGQAMSARPEALTDRLSRGGEKHPVFFFHAFPRPAIQFAINFELYVTPQAEVLPADLPAQFLVAYLRVPHHDLIIAHFIHLG